MSVVLSAYRLGGIKMAKQSVRSIPFSLPVVDRVWLNYFSTAFLLTLGVLFYTVFGSYHIRLYSSQWQPVVFGLVAVDIWRFRDVLLLAYGLYLIFLLPYYWFNPAVESKAFILYRWLLGRITGRDGGGDQEARQAVLSLLLKFIFIPFCINGLLGHFAILNNQILAVVGAVDPMQEVRQMYSRVWHSLVMNLILVFDFVPFVVGYMIELPALKNRIRSVDDSLLGWVVCLACYPPFNESVGKFLTWGTRDFVVSFMLPSPWLFYTVNGLLLVLFALYASASVSLGFKCGNLCNRGVVSTGLYGVIRHPAYLLKNLAWWVAAIPVLFVISRQSISLAVYGALSLAAWSCIYAARAITEERHFLRTGSEYSEYMQRVRWRFIPGLV
jgi:protein-S-isoprenylcysteine O-methyltransferase Ste14